MKYIADPTMKTHQQMIDEDAGKAWELIKNDWYGLDQLYNRDHPEGLFWQVIHKCPSPPSHLPFVNEKALHMQYDHIRKFYGEPEAEWFIERKFPYLNKTTMTRVVDDTVRCTLWIIDRLKHIDIRKLKSSSEILPAEFMIPYEMPLGDD
jgi:hypothetical protein